MKITCGDEQFPVDEVVPQGLLTLEDFSAKEALFLRLEIPVDPMLRARHLCRPHRGCITTYSSNTFRRFEGLSEIEAPEGELSEWRKWSRERDLL